MTAFAGLQKRYCNLVLNSRLALPDSLPKLIHVSITEQSLYFYSNKTLAAKYPVSTAANGVGCQEGSGCTPRGWHVVKSRIGSGVPVATIFRGRVAAGVASDLCDTSNDDLITSRILWLSGLEADINCGGDVDSYQRYIYIHGTAQEHLIGSPVSHGCIRMRNRDVIELFELVAEQTPVFISCG